ncbi:hypothetical protein FACS1894219_06370 [Clostridia bacterium]|nr:hypothetical protein FACS1894219_06370 [Clostridia bacterium]
MLVSKGKGANIAKAIKDGIEIAVANSAKKAPDENGYGVFYAGATNGIPVMELSGTKVEKAVYFVRNAPKADGGVYTAASKPVKISVSGEQKAPKYKINTKTQTIKLKKGDIIFAGNPENLSVNYDKCNSATVDLLQDQLLLVTAAKGTLVSLSKYFETSADTIVIWRAGTDKRAPTAKQIITLEP